jgi:CubicO group peptidase (beta-lactamase class C family)
MSGTATAPSVPPLAVGPAVPSARAGRAITDILARHGIVTAGMGVIRDGELVWERYSGEQSPGVPATSGTRFNVASITKTVTAEAILRLAGQGRFSLDEPMAPHWADPHVADDPRHLALTPRMALNHTTGFPNWRFFLRGGRLAFQHAPGERFGYSGEGIEYVARFAERKLGRPFPELVAETVLEPVGMTRTSIVVRRADTASIARPVDMDGRFHGYYCRPEGSGWCRAEGNYSAADDMVTTVRDYAAFLRSVIDADGYGAAIAADRDRVQADKGDQRVVDCAAVATVPCPDSQGYGLGFNVLRYGDVTVLEHGGADWSELSVAYLAKPSRSGVIVFLNAPNRRALAAMPELLEQIDPASPFLPEYRGWLAEARAREAAGP